jgi:hypothetical protein
LTRPKVEGIPEQLKDLPDTVNTASGGKAIRNSSSQASDSANVEGAVKKVG